MGGGMRRRRKLGLIASVAFIVGVFSATDAAPAAAQAPRLGSFLLTVSLRHDETKTADQINEHLRQTEWYDNFPLTGSKSWRGT